MDTVVKDQSPSMLRDWLRQLKPQQVRELFAVAFIIEGVRIGVPKLSGFQLQHVKMFFATAQLVPGFL